LLALTAVALASAVSASELLVTNYFGNSLTRFDWSGNSLGTYSGGTLSGPLGMSTGSDGLLYVTSESNNSVQRFNTTTHAYVDTIASGAGLNGPTAVTFDGGGNLLVANFNDSSVGKFSSGGSYQGQFVTPGSGGLNGPDIGTTIGPDGNLYAMSFYGNSILKYNGSNGAYIGAFVTAGSGGLTQPRTILWHNGKVYVSSDNGNKVLRYNLDGSFSDIFVAAGSGGLNGAVGMVFGEDNNLYLVSWRNSRILKYDGTTGAFLSTFASTGLNGPVGLAVVPEPATIVALGVAALWRLRRRK